MFSRNRLLRRISNCDQNSHIVEEIIAVFSRKSFMNDASKEVPIYVDD